MRIQHNIAAMNAYRNYNSNTSALSKNLEKLSSGYKINRAGDDAAGLAISEKMRAQITGLNAAQKNVKDGVSLVKTAEGAMQEIQDMLNRMDYLATQSANGTYDNEVDRANLQKEVVALKTEINRIAESANFNGIKLLNGDLDATEAVSKTFTSTKEDTVGTVDSSLLPPKGNTLSVNTVLHKDGANSTAGTTFSVDLHNTVFANNAANGDKAASKMTLTVGDKSWELEGNGNGELKGEDLAQALVDKINEKADADGNVELFNGQMFKVSLGENGDNRITFQQVNAPSGADSEVDGDMKVEITGDVGSGTASAGVPATKAKYTIDLSNATNTTIKDQTTIDQLGQAAYDANLTAAGKTEATATDTEKAAAEADRQTAIAGATAKIDGIAVVFDGNIDKTMQKFVEDYNGYKDPATGNTKNYTASWDGKVLTLEAKYAGALDPSAAGDGTTVPQTAPALTNFGALTQNKDAVKEVQTLDLTGATQASVAAKSVDGVAIDWDTDLDTTMKKFVEKYNAESSKAYTAEWADNKLTMTAKVAGTAGGTTTGVPAAGLISTDVAHQPATKATLTITVTGADASVADNDTITINGTQYTVKDTGGDITTADAKDANKLAEFIASKLASNDYDISVEDNVITYTAKTAGAAATQPPFSFTATQAGGGTAASVDGSGKGVFVAGTDVGTGAATFVQKTAGDDAGVTAGVAPTLMEEEVAGAAANGDGVVVIGTADYNFKTTAIKNVTAEAGGRLASTYFDLTEEMVSDGGKFQIGKSEYTFSSNAANEGADGVVYIGDLVDADGNVDIAGNLDTIAQRVTDAAKGNTTWTVGHEKGGSTLSFVENQNQEDYTGDEALTSVDNIAKTFGWTTPGDSSSKEVQTTAGGKGTALTLQIGDTSEEFNQMSVSIGDMHTAAMVYTDDEGNQTSIADIDISSQEGAQKAVDVIKNAINYVSSVRGDLGAIQNRLEHTQNNLSVMAENIQDAESTIRDTDVAEEMMSYVKNNILVQSAQAMLAQANQLPQGVLQLLG